MDWSQGGARKGWQLSPGGRRFYDPTSGWEPLTLTADQVRQVMVEQFSLTATWIQLMPGGYLNQTWSVAADNTDWVIRVSRPGRTLDQVDWEQRAARIWQQAVPQVVVAEGFGEADEAAGSPPRPVTLFRHCHSDPVTDATTPTQHLTMARVLAQLHAAALTEPLPQRPGMGRIDDDVPDLFGWQVVRAEALTQNAAGPVAAAVEQIDAEIDQVAARLDQLRRYGILDVAAQAWNDLNPRNRLYRGDTLVGLIDSDDACVQPLAWEVGKELYGHPAVSPEEFLNEYHRAGGPVIGDPAALSVFGRLGDLTAILWMTEYGDGVTVASDAADKIRDLAHSL